MKEIGAQEEIGENRMVLPELTDNPTDNFPIHYELLTSTDKLPSIEQNAILENEPSRRMTFMPQEDATKDVGALLAPEACAALRAALAGKVCPNTQTPPPHPPPPSTTALVPSPVPVTQALISGQSMGRALSAATLLEKSGDASVAATSQTPTTTLQLQAQPQQQLQSPMIGLFRTTLPQLSQERTVCDGKVPVIKTSTGSFVVTVNPQAQAQTQVQSHPTPPLPQISRSLVNRPMHFRPKVKSTAGDPVLYTVPERRISVQAPAPPPPPPPPAPAAPALPLPLPQVALSHPATFLVQDPVGKYCIMERNESGSSQGRVLDSRMLPIEMTPPRSHAVPQPKATIFQKPTPIQVLDGTNLKPGLSAIVPQPQTGKVVHQELTHSLVERPAVSEGPSVNTTTLTAAAESLMTMFMSEDNKLPPAASPWELAAPLATTTTATMAAPLPSLALGEQSNRAFDSTEVFYGERRDTGHKRKKTSTPIASLDDLNIASIPSSSSHPGLDLLLQAAKLAGDELPVISEATKAGSKLHSLVAGGSGGAGLGGAGGSHIHHHFRKMSVNELRRRTVESQHPLSSRVVPFLDRTFSKFSSVLDNFTGVYPLLDGSFIARCRYKGCCVQIGVFKSAEHAARAYDRVVLGIRGRKIKTNYPDSDYLSFELDNAKRAFEAKCKQCQQTRRGSAWPWARAAQTLLANDEDEMMSSTCHDCVLSNVPELVQNVAPLTEALPGKSVFKILQNIMLKKRDLNGTVDLIQAKIIQLQQRIQSGLSTDEECDCVGQYACVANILSSMVSMQKEWEKKQETLEDKDVVIDIPPPNSLSLKTEMMTSSSLSEPKQVISQLFEERDLRSPNKQSISEGNSRDFPHSLLTPFSPKVPPSSCHSDPIIEDGDCDHPIAWMDLTTRDEQLGESSSLGGIGSGTPLGLGVGTGGGSGAVGLRSDLNSCPYTESIRWVRLLASSLWPRKRGGGMLWKAYQPLFKSSHHRNSILQLREELFMKTDHLGECQSEKSNT